MNSFDAQNFISQYIPQYPTLVVQFHWRPIKISLTFIWNYGQKTMMKKSRLSLWNQHRTRNVLMDVSIWKKDKRMYPQKEKDNTCWQWHVSSHSGALYHLPPSILFMTTQFRNNGIPSIMTATQIPDYEQFHHCFRCPHVQLQAYMRDQTHRIIVVHEPPIWQWKHVQISLNQLFVLNDDHRYLWRLTGIDRSCTNQDYVMFMARGVNNHGWTRIVILREWTTVKDKKKRHKEVEAEKWISGSNCWKSCWRDMFGFHCRIIELQKDAKGCYAQCQGVFRISNHYRHFVHHFAKPLNAFTPSFWIYK